MRRHNPNDSYSPFAGHDRLRGGRADFRDTSEFDPDELARGIEHEMEHTDDPRIAREIASDHLAEDGAYYTHLEAMERGAFSSNAAKTRYIGFCPVCEGHFKCQAERGRYYLVHHGYKRPGEGYIIGDCFGVGREPHEVSPELAKDYRDALIVQLGRLRESYDNLPQLTSLFFTNWRTNRPEKITPEDPNWARRFDEHKSSLKFQIGETERAVKRTQRHVDTWKRAPLKTVEEEVEQIARQKRERATQLATEREQKRADMIAGVQRRIDSAVRNQNQSALGNIYESLCDNYRAKLKVETKQDVLEIIDRPHVWRAFGLMKGDQYIIPHWRETEANVILRKMTWPRPGEAIPWPSELGEPKVKRRQRPNAHETNGGYYVWILGADGLPPQTEGPHGPHDLDGAKTFARIAATEGRHDRVVSLGRDPTVLSFEVVCGYRSGTGERFI